MSNNSFLEKLATQLGASATVKNVFGEPVTAGDKTIIPVARIAYGLGGGYGQGNKKLKNKKDTNLAVALPPNKDDVTGEGGRGGGGIYAVPKGVYEITPTETRFIPTDNTKQILIGVAIGFLVKALFFSRRRKV